MRNLLRLYLHFVWILQDLAHLCPVAAVVCVIGRLVLSWMCVVLRRHPTVMRCRRGTGPAPELRPRGMGVWLPPTPQPPHSQSHTQAHARASTCPAYSVGKLILSPRD
eukprot:1328049-Prymnesium_polylepis.1